MRVPYTYRIQFPNGEFYLGVRLAPEGLSPWEDEYFGSPVTHKSKWSNHHIKGDIKIHSSIEEAQDYEKDLIRPNLNNPLCLNENCGGFYSLLTIRKATEASQRKQKELLESDPKWRAKVLEKMSKMQKEAARLWREDEENKRRRLKALADGRATQKNLRKDENYKKEEIERMRLNSSKAVERKKELRKDPNWRAMEVEKSKENQKKAADACRGTFFINNGLKNRRIKLGTPIPEGWEKGVKRRSK